VVGALHLGLQMVSGFESVPTLFVEVYLAFSRGGARKVSEAIMGRISPSLWRCSFLESRAQQIV
jgi:hypothetical protein